MRLTYVFAVLIAAILHVSGTAISTTKESNRGIISNVASTNILHNIDAVQEDGGRRLRRVDDAKTLENEIDQEERGFMEALKKAAAKKLPWTKTAEKARFAKKMREEVARRQRVKENIAYAST